MQTARWSFGLARIPHCPRRRWICCEATRLATGRCGSRSRALRTGGGRGTYQPQTLRCSPPAAGDGGEYCADRSVRRFRQRRSGLISLTSALTPHLYQAEVTSVFLATSIRRSSKARSSSARQRSGPKLTSSSTICSPRRFRLNRRRPPDTGSQNKWTGERSPSPSNSPR